MELCDKVSDDYESVTGQRGMYWLEGWCDLMATLPERQY